MKQKLFMKILLLILVCILNVSGAEAITENSRSVELYTTSWCPYCRKAEAFLTANGIPFVSYDIEKDKAAALRKKQLDKRKGVPLAVINGQTIYGFSERLYRTALDLEE